MPARIYRTMLDPTALARWKVPEGMTLRVHEFEPREGLRPGVSVKDNETGWRMALDKLAALVQS